MTDQERIQAFAREFEALQQRYGVTLVARTVPADTPVPVTPPIQISLIQGWHEPEKQ